MNDFDGLVTELPDRLETGCPVYMVNTCLGLDTELASV